MLFISITKCHIHIPSYLTELGVFWWLFRKEDTLWCLSWACISVKRRRKNKYPLFQNVISPSYDFKLVCDFQYSTSLILFIDSLSFNHMSKAPRHLMLHFTILYTWRLTSNISEGLYLISQLIAFLNISG